jgi:hypothetical protein
LIPEDAAAKEQTMADRKRSHDGVKETEQMFGEADRIGQKGRAGGRLAREIGTEDEKKRAYERPAGATRVTKSDEEEG